MEEFKGDSLAAAQQYILSNRAMGVNCPCCNQFCKLYRRKLNSNMARFLISLFEAWYDQGQKGWVHYKQLKFTGRDYPYLKMWNLAETPIVTPSGAKKMSGLWRPTERGIDFVLQRITVPSHVNHHRKNVFGFEDAQVSINAALGRHFNYGELMGWYPVNE